ncbi:hypothetical protein FIBSPDRAFT_427726 [Athelia psychrophila]|uniref:Uncharacterized protein n=1 Tax=Athelia psychrophila TaxID=1759441 RepID=A0A166MTR8_9AGAM|nr:hypothetical protein FIBSPDRAFT_427726 [Fibularhizoctonia sp. CBS 109695]
MAGALAFFVGGTSLGSMGMESIGIMGVNMGMAGLEAAVCGLVDATRAGGPCGGRDVRGGWRAGHLFADLEATHIQLQALLRTLHITDLFLVSPILLLPVLPLLSPSPGSGMRVGAAQQAGLTLTPASLGPVHLRCLPWAKLTLLPRFVSVLFGAYAESARIRLAREHLKRHQRRPVPTRIPRFLPPQRRTERGGVVPHVRLGIRFGHTARLPCTQRNSSTGHARAASISLALRRLPGMEDLSTGRVPFQSLLQLHL